MKKCGKKRIFLYLLLAIASFFCIFFLNHQYNTIYHTLDGYPSGVNITFYQDPFSRGFSWWTEAEEDETRLYLSEHPFDEAELADARFSAGNLEMRNFTGVYFVEGEVKYMSDPTRWGRLFSIEYCNHTVSVEGLLPEQQYYYAIGGNGQYHYGDFVTESDQETVIVNFNDFQTNDGTKLFLGGQTLNAALQSVGQKIDFFAFGGDFTSVFSIGDQNYNHYLGWIKSRESLSEYVDDKPMIMAPGNHDAAENLFTYNHMISYDGVSDNGGYYSFNYNNVHLVTLNSNELNDEQYSWLQEDLEATKKNEAITWILLMIHQGPYTTGDHGFVLERGFVEKIARLCSAYHVDLVLQAHDHTYSKTLPYLWDSSGITKNETDQAVINRSVLSVQKNGIEYDYNPHGTYYVSCGASGHRVGENVEYALPYGEKSFKNREYQVAVSEITVDSNYADAGDVASIDVGRSMFGTIQVVGETLVYEFFAVDDHGAPVLFDRLAVLKENEK